MVVNNQILQQIGESFEQIGKDIAKETVQAPKDIVGKALESLGSGSTSKKVSGQNSSKQSAQPIEKISTESDETKQSVARAALAELAGGKKPQEPSDYEKKLQEEEQKKQEKEQKKKAASMTLQQQSTKRKRGDLFGLKAKKSSTEIGKNVRQD